MDSSRYFSIKLFLRDERRNSDGKAMIYARIRLDRNKIELSTNKSVKPAHWDAATCTVTRTKEATTINQHVEAFKARINNAYSQLYIAQQEITLESIKALALG